MPEQPKPEKKPVLVLRDRMGGLSDRMKTYVKDLNKIRKDLTNALKTGPKTVPELAQAAGLRTSDAMWHVMAMKKYGQVAERERKGDYYTYGLVHKE